MAHLAVETLLAQTAREVAAKGNTETDDTLREFGKCVVSLRHTLYRDRPFSTYGLLRFGVNRREWRRLEGCWWGDSNHGDLSLMQCHPNT